MPIVTIHSGRLDSAAAIERLAADVREAGSKALNTPLDNVWVMVQPVVDPIPHPPVVLVRANQGRSPVERESFVKAVSEAVGRGLSVPAAQVWVHYQEMSPGDIWFGGRWTGPA